MRSIGAIRRRLRAIFDPAIMSVYSKILYRRYVVKKDLFGPFVPYVFDEYAKSKVRLMIVGQQTNGWKPLKAALEDRELYNELQESSKEFANAEGYNSPFWSFAHALNKSINGDNRLGFVWTNLAKIEQDNGLPTPPFLQFNTTDFCILDQEIEAIDPQAVVFLCGPHYDDFLFSLLFPSKASGSLRLEAVKGQDTKALAKIRGLPYRAYRCYHPSYLRRTKNSEPVLRILSSAILSG